MVPELQGNGKKLPMSKSRRGKVLPRCVQKVSGKVCDHSRMERNWFTQGVDRVIGLAHDLKQRLRRLLQTKQDGNLTKEEWALREKQHLVIKVSETEGEIETTESLLIAPGVNSAQMRPMCMTTRRRAKRHGDLQRGSLNWGRNLTT